VKEALFVAALGISGNGSAPAEEACRALVRDRFGMFVREAVNP